MPAIQHSKGAALSEPKLYRKNTLLQRNRGMRQTVKVVQENRTRNKSCSKSSCNMKLDSNFFSLSKK